MIERTRNKMRAAALRRSLGRNAEVRRVLRGRPISAGVLLMLQRHFERLPPSRENNRMVGVIRALQWVAARLVGHARMRIAASQTITAKAIRDANVWFERKALAELERLVETARRAANHEPVGDPLEALRDVLTLQMIADECGRLGIA